VSPDGAHGAAVGGTATLTPQLTMLRDAVAALTNVPPESLEVSEAAAAHDELRSLCDRIRVFSARLLSHVEADGRWASSGGSRTFPEWVARRAGASVGAARREAALGRALTEDLPATRAAAGAGRISLEHAQVLSQLAPTSDARRAVLASDRTDRNEEFLVGAATRMGVDDYRRTVRRWAAAVDEAAHEAEHLAAEAKEYLYVTPRRDGMDVQGFLTAEHGDVLVTALRAVTGVPAADDTRTPDQRRAAALTGLAHLVLDRGLVGGGGALVRPHISVHVSWETMQRLAREHAEHEDAAADGTSLTGPAELDDGTPIPTSVLARIACDSEMTRVVFGPARQPLDVGRSQRTYTGAIRRAVVARDRHCQYPGCSAPPTLGEVHHTRWWGRDNGTTSVSTGILLCWYHHKVVHQRSLAIRRSTDGAWEFRRVDGRQLGPPVGSWAGESRPGGSPPGTGAVGAAPGGEPDDPRPPRGSPVDQDVHVTPEVQVTPNPRVTAHLQDELPLAG